MKELVISVNGMNCGHCKNAVETELKDVDGVENAEVSLENKNVTVTLNKDVAIDKLYEAIDEAGFEPVK